MPPSFQKYLKFHVPNGFHVEVPNSRCWPRQELAAGGIAMTANRMLVRTIHGPWRTHVRTISEGARIHTDEASRLREARAGDRLLFLLPGDALGDNVGYFLFIQSVIEQLSPARIGVFNCGGASDIYHLDPKISVFPLWITERQIGEFDCVLDLLDAPELRTLAVSPCDTETTLLKHFGLKSTDRYPTAPEQRGKPTSIGIFPLASTPMRSLPIELCKFLIGRAKDAGVKVTVHLNHRQRQSRYYMQALRTLQCDKVRLHRGCSSLAELISVIGRTEYGIFCDSGPAHLSKLFATRGIAVHTSADAEILHGRFSNLQAWQSGYKGSYCAAPCGLAGPRADSRNRVGCMGSLRVLRSELLARAVLIDDLTNHAMIENPIPCVEYLNRSKTEIWEAIEDAWAQDKMLSA